MFRLSSLLRIFTFTLLMGLSLAAQAQELCKSEDLTFDYVATESTCQRNGSLTFTPRGTDASNFANYTYEIRSSVSGGVNIPASLGVIQADGISSFHDKLPSGNYRVVISAQCTFDPTYTYNTVLENVIVPGNYNVPNVYLDNTLSRGAYANCPKGKIALHVSGGRDNLTFEVTQSPNDEFNGPIEPLKQGSSYIFPGSNYPAGEYIVEVHDVDCDYTAVCNFTLTEMTELPKLANEQYPYNLFLALTEDNASCSKVMALFYIDKQFYQNRPAIIEFIDEGGYEVSVAPTGVEPTVWKTLTRSSSQRDIFDLGVPVETLHSNGSLTVHIRVADCPQHVRTLSAHLIVDFYKALTDLCGTSELTTSLPSSGVRSHFCFPLTQSVYESQAAYNSGAAPIATYTFNSRADKAVHTLRAGETRYFRVVGPHGYVYLNTNYTGRNLALYRHNLASDRLYCDGFITGFYHFGGTTCPDMYYNIYDRSDPANPVQLCGGSLKSDSRTCKLPYDTPLRAVLLIDGQESHQYIDFQRSLNDYQPKSRLYSTNNCLINVGRFYTDNSFYIPWGTRYVITGPNDFKQEVISTSETWNIYWPEARLDPGTYTFTVYMGDCVIREQTLTLPVLLDVRDFEARIETDCAQAKVYPTGLLIQSGHERPENTYFRIVSGPEGGYDPSQRISRAQADAGVYFSLSRPGIYMIGICQGTNSCALDQLPVEFALTNLRLDNVRTIAFSCLDNDDAGHMYIRAIDGVGEPELYTYELYDAENVEAIPVMPQPDGDRVHFAYGKKGQTYTVRIEDDCGNRFSQQVTILDLSKLTLASAIRPTVCVGDPLELTSLPLGSYTWERETAPGSNVWEELAPDLVHQQNPVIPNAQPSHSGRYRVHLAASGCSGASVGYVNIQVVPCYAPINPVLMNKVVE